MKTIAIILFISALTFPQIDQESEFGYFYEVMPEIIGGLQSIQNRLVYPDSALKNGIEGKVYVLAIIDSIGNIQNARIIKGIGYGCDEEAIRLVMSAKCTPGFIRVKKRPGDNNKDRPYSLAPYQCAIPIPLLFKLN